MEMGEPAVETRSLLFLYLSNLTTCSSYSTCPRALGRRRLGGCEASSSASHNSVAFGGVEPDSSSGTVAGVAAQSEVTRKKRCPTLTSAGCCVHAAPAPAPPGRRRGPTTTQGSPAGTCCRPCQRSGARRPGSCPPSAVRVAIVRFDDESQHRIEDGSGPRASAPSSLCEPRFRDTLE